MKKTVFSRIFMIIIASIFMSALSTTINGYFSLDTLSDSITYMVTVLLIWNIICKINNKKIYKITLRYWLMVFLVLSCVVTFYYTSKGTTWLECGKRSIFFFLFLVLSIFFYNLVYKKELRKLLQSEKNIVAKLISKYLIDNGIETIMAEKFSKELVSIIFDQPLHDKKDSSIFFAIYSIVVTFVIDSIFDIYDKTTSVVLFASSILMVFFDIFKEITKHIIKKSDEPIENPLQALYYFYDVE